MHLVGRGRLYVCSQEENIVNICQNIIGQQIIGPQNFIDLANKQNY
jgi:hypothetical protein